MRMGIGLGIGINRSNYAQGIFSAYQSRVTADGGVTEAGACVDAVSGLLQTASLLLIPSGYKSGKAYAEIPTNGNGDLTWTRASTALRTNSSGLLESMGSGVPRLSYMYGSCPALLLEPQRTNLALYSEQLDNVSWAKVFSSVTANSTTSPDGNTTADTFTADGSNNQHYVAGPTSGTITSGSSYTYTIYAKKNTNNFIQLWISNTFGGMFANFDLNNGVVGTLGVGSGGSNPTSSITSVGNGWYRCSMTFVPTTTGVVGLLVAMTSSASTVRAEANTLSTSVFLWGAQLELGAYATTIIPTTTASATRVADSFSRNNIYTNGLITSSGGTWFVELRGNVAYTGGITQAQLLGLGNDAVGATANNFWIACSDATRTRIWKQVAGALTQLYTTTTDTTKIAIKWNGSSADVFANGTKVVSATAFTTTALESLRTVAVQHPYFIQAMGLHPTPLTDAQCIELTTL